MDACLMVWNIRPQTRAYKFTGHKDAIFCVRFSPTGELIVTASRDKTVKLWVPSIFSPDSRLIISSSDDKTIKLWDTETQSCVHTFHETNGFASHLDFHPSGNCFAAGSTNSSVKLWDLRMNRLLQHYDAHNGPVHNVSCHPNGHFLLSASEDSTLKIFDLVEGRPLYTLQGHTGPVTAAAFSASGDHFASGGNDEQEIPTKSPNKSPSRILTTSDPASRSKSIQINRRVLCPESNSVGGCQMNGSESEEKEDKQSSNTPETTVDYHESPTGDTLNPRTSVKCHFPHIIRNQSGISTPSTLPLTSNLNVAQFGNSKTPVNLDDERQNVPPSLSTTLEHIFSQLDILTQTVSIVEQRLTLLENKSTNNA
ncbi:unnamed protein product [Trichobilharzia regenti]|nr:unnamed protein product [Trichobilharzia regenti]